MTRQGKLPMALWFEDDALVAAGGDERGVLHMHQFQYYPAKAYGKEASPFLNSAAELRALHHHSAKPTVVGEFPIEGLPLVSA